MNLKSRAKKLKSNIPAVYLALKNKNTPIIAKIFAGITVAYALSPIDLIPDFIPIVGYLDDIILLPALIALTIKFIPKEIMQYCAEQSEQMQKDGILKKWYYSLPILIIWLFIIAALLKIIL